MGASPCPKWPPRGVATTPPQLSWWQRTVASAKSQWAAQRGAQAPSTWSSTRPSQRLLPLTSRNSGVGGEGRQAVFALKIQQGAISSSAPRGGRRAAAWFSQLEPAPHRGSALAPMAQVQRSPHCTGHLAGVCTVLQGQIPATLSASLLPSVLRSSPACWGHLCEPGQSSRESSPSAPLHPHLST